jgi:hypothetical protein
MKLKAKSLKSLKILTVAEVATKLKVHTWLIEAAIRKGELVGSRRFGEFYIKEDDLLRFLEKGDQG